MTLTHATVPDLLRRFSSTPYCAIIGVGNIPLRVETNDLAIISEMQKASVQRGHSYSDGLLFLKVIRDKDAPCDGGAVTILLAYPLLTLRVGVGTMIVLDCESREAMGFLSPDVAAEEFACTLFPLICNLLIDSVSATPTIHPCW